MAVITRAVSEADEVIVAWGNPPAGRSAKEFEKRTQEVLTVLHQRHEIVYCVGTTNGGHPRHPRVWYMRKNCRKVPFLRFPDLALQSAPPRPKSSAQSCVKFF